jgi:hypothetical protein
LGDHGAWIGDRRLKAKKREHVRLSGARDSFLRALRHAAAKLLSILIPYRHRCLRLTQGSSLWKARGGLSGSSGDARVEFPPDREAPPLRDKGEREDIESLPHARFGALGDGVVHRADLGERVKLDTAVRRFVVTQCGRCPSVVNLKSPRAPPRSNGEASSVCSRTRKTVTKRH